MIIKFIKTYQKFQSIKNKEKTANWQAIKRRLEVQCTIKFSLTSVRKFKFF
jgi:hypothetical protein